MIQNGNLPMAKDDEAPDWAKREIAEAVRILREDGLHIHKTYEQYMASKDQDKTDPEPTETDTEGQPPPAKDNPTDPPAKKSLWWGERK